MEQQLYSYQPKQPTDNEVLQAFPEAKQIIPKKLKELEQKREMLVATIKERLATINNEPDEFSRWFSRKWLKLNQGEELEAIDKDIARLKRQLSMIKGFVVPKGTLTDDLIQAAREVPVESLLHQDLRRTGRTLIGLCPFHTEKTPSFHVYPKENRAWCFGCNQGGDTITIYMLLHDCDFKNAVLLLTGERA